MKELNIIQTELNAPKSQHNNFGNYDYRSCEDILEALKPLFKETGCTVILSDEIVLVGDRHYVKATATITNASGESLSNTAFAREPLVKKGSDESQITGAASSYARKYALAGLFCIDDNRDTDYEEQPTYDQNGMVVAPPPTDKKRGRKKQSAPVENLPPDPATHQAPQAPDMIAGGELNHALQELTFVTSQEGLNALWKAHPNLQKDVAFINAVKANPFHPNNLKK